MSLYPQIEKFLNERRKQMSEGRFDLIPWDELAARCEIPAQTLRNWKEGKNVPSRESDINNLARVFGDGIYAALNRLPPGIDPAFLRLYLGAKQDPNLARILDDAMEKAREYQAQPTGQLQLTV